MKITGIATAVVLPVIAGWLGMVLGGLGEPSTDTSPAWALKPPTQIGSSANDGMKELATSSGVDIILRPNYSDGNSQFMLLLQHPALELNSHLTSSGITNIISVHGVSYGIYGKEQMPIYVQVIEKTITMVIGSNNQNSETLVGLIEPTYNTVKKQQQVLAVAQR